MKRLVLFVVVISAVLPIPAAPDIHIPWSVAGNGAGESEGTTHILVSTVGQAVVGVMSSAMYFHEAGFWYVTAPQLSDVEVTGGDLPRVFEFGVPYPNPSRFVTTLQMAVPSRSHVMVKLYDVTGRVVRTLVDTELDAGYHVTTLEAAGLSGGIYFCRMSAGEFTETRRLILVR